MSINVIPPVVKRLYRLLPSILQRKLLFISFSVFLLAILDLVGLGVLLPVLVLVVSENSLTDNRYLSLVYDWGGFESNRSFILMLCGMIFIISLVRILLSTFVLYKQNRSLYAINTYLSINLYHYYYERGFLFIKKNNSHQLINRINSVSANLITGYFFPYTQLLCEIFVMSSILIGLMSFNVYVFGLVLCTFVPFTVFYYRFTRAKIKQYGAVLNQLAPLRGKLLQQTFVGYSDMAISNAFPACASHFAQLLGKQNYITIRNFLINNSFQKMLEVAVVCSVVVLIIATQLFHLPSLGVIVGLFTIAVYRVLPGLIRSVGYLYTIRGNVFSLYLLDDLEADRAEKKLVVEQQAIAFRQAIQIEHIYFSYQPDVPVLHGFSLEIRKGDFVGIKGESGSGKSTLFHLLLGFLTPDSGTIRVDGVSLSPEVMVSWHSKIGYVSQQLFMIEGTLLDNIVMSAGGSVPDRGRVLQVLRQASLDKFVSALPQGIDTPVGEAGCLLSGGQRQRLGIARALYKEVEILLFDEATSSLDATTECAINNAILHLADERTDLTLLVISHRQESLAICRRIIQIEDLQDQ